MSRLSINPSRLTRRLPLNLIFFAAVLLCCRVAISAESTPAPSSEEMIGHDLFVHVWTRHDPLAAAGDGLGPLFNERSCAACHNQAGIGGGETPGTTSSR